MTIAENGRVNDLVDFERIGVFGGGGSCPLGYWRALLDHYDIRTAPVYVELYQEPLNLAWGSLSNNKRIQVTRSTSDLNKEYQFGGRVSAAVVRPGPQFDPNKLYKVTLYSRVNYQYLMLTLTFGVYPDFYRYSFDNLPNSVLIEEAPVGYQVPTDHDGYYDVASYYIKYATKLLADTDTD